jgi:hypothetical protein
MPGSAGQIHVDRQRAHGGQRAEDDGEAMAVMVAVEPAGSGHPLR